MFEVHLLSTCITPQGETFYANLNNVCKCNNRLSQDFATAKPESDKKSI